MGNGEIMRKKLLDWNSGGEENWGEAKESYGEGTFQYQCDAILNKCGNLFRKTPLNFRQDCKQLQLLTVQKESN